MFRRVLDARATAIAVVEPTAASFLAGHELRERAMRPGSGRFVIEMAPIPDGSGALRGVVAEGPVGSRWFRWLRIFRYEIRRWRDGVISDVDEAVESPQRLTDDPLLAQRMLDLVPAVPTPVWGRDELHGGDMWNSNSLTSWLIVGTGLDLESVHLPAGGRAPGWGAGLVVANGFAASDSRTDRSSSR